MPRTMIGFWLIAVTSLVPAAQTAAPEPAAVLAALADPSRPPEQVELDVYRKPALVIAFAGIKRGDKIADFMSGNAYFTRLFSRIVGPQGRVYAFLPAEELAHCAPEETAATRLLVQSGHYSNVRLLSDAANRFAAPEPLDVVWTAQNYHDLHDKFMAPSDSTSINAAIFKALKPGGILLVIDHSAAAGSGLRDTETLHRIDPASIRNEVTAAGFLFEAQSDLLSNPRDGHDLAVFDPAIRHHTDQVILKFRKPPAGA